ncbi:hypothetical protein FDECE_8578 [Fusarium decemcellulare]|nr:hypothetical protein FDECE_8578 [Fusarium decemcellulare]
MSGYASTLQGADRITIPPPTGPSPITAPSHQILNPFPDEQKSRRASIPLPSPVEAKPTHACSPASTGPDPLPRRATTQLTPPFDATILKPLDPCALSSMTDAPLPGSTLTVLVVNALLLARSRLSRSSSSNISLHKSPERVGMINLLSLPPSTETPAANVR